MRITILRSLVFIGVTLVAIAAQASAASFSDIIVPGESLTVAFDVNNAGVIVGEYGCCSGSIGVHGFVLSAGIFTTLDVPGASGTQLTAISDGGQIGGTYNIGGGNNHGFVYSGGVLIRLTFLARHLRTSGA